TVEHLRQSHEKYSPLRAKDVLGDEEIGEIIGMNSLKVLLRAWVKHFFVRLSNVYRPMNLSYRLFYEALVKHFWEE
ncbi:MAG: hypothetical protein M3Y76_09760, partial [Chloroflexota bacterium]|nr:hypothetical protein [Chloroflexota bacterium]